MKDIKLKLTSDRLWVVGLYLALLVANAKLGLGIDDAQLTEACYAVIAFVLGKSWRATTAGGVVASLIPGAVATMNDALEAGANPINKEPPIDPAP